MAPLRRSEAILAVIKFVDGWRILPGGGNSTPYASQEAALVVARRLIEAAELSGRKVELLVHDGFGELGPARAANPPRPPPVEHGDPRRPSEPQRFGRGSPRPACGPAETEERAAVDESPTRFFPANASGAGHEMGRYPALLVMRLRSRSPWWVSRPESGHLGDAPGNDR